MHLALLNLISFPRTDFSSLSRFLWISFCFVNCTTQLGIISKLAGGAVDSTFCVTDVKDYLSLNGLVNPPGHRTVDHSPTTVTIQIILYPLNKPAFASNLEMKMWCGTMSKGLAQVQVDDSSCIPFVHQCCSSIMEGHWIDQA